MVSSFIKELLSKHLMGLIAAHQGYYIVENINDYGVDFSISKLINYTINGKNRFFNSGQTCDVQLKCTTSEELIETPKSYKFDLKANNYNDLIFRKKETNANKTPLILLLVVVPSKKDWLTIQDKKLEIEAKRFWFVPNEKATFSNNKKTVRIEIPKTNVVNTLFFKELFKTN